MTDNPNAEPHRLVWRYGLTLAAISFVTFLPLLSLRREPRRERQVFLRRALSSHVDLRLPLSLKERERTAAEMLVDYEERGEKSETRKSAISKESYDKFSIQMFDFYWKTTVPAKPGDKDEYVMMEFDQSQSNQISVEWTRVHYRGSYVGEENLGTAYDLDGKPYRPGRRVDGRLLLYPTKDCWELAADIRYVK